MKSYFFVSYAGKEDRRWVQRFHADLEYELGLLVGTAVGGILDTRPRPGMDPDLALAAGAGRIRSMVALCSDPFFKDGWCGREWEVFGARVENFSKAGATRLEDGFLRVLWRPTRDPVPPAARSALADARLGLPEVYGQHGLLWLMRNMRRGPSGYYAFVRLFAARVIAAEQIDLDPLPQFAIRAVGPAFGSHGLDGTGQVPIGTSADLDRRPSAGGPVWRQGLGSPAPELPASVLPASQLPASDLPSDRNRGDRGAGVFVPTTVDSAQAAPRRVAVSYVGADQQWADWLEHLLRRGCHEVRQVRWAQNRGERLAETVDRIASWQPEITIVLLSRHFRAPRPEHPGTTETEAWERLGEEGPLARRVVRITIDPQPLPEPLRALRTLDLSGLEPAVVNELLMEVQAGGGW
jgi:hypothetical protein